MQNQPSQFGPKSDEQLPLAQNHLQKCSTLDGANYDKQMFLENSQSNSSQQYQVTRKTTIHQSSYNMAPTSANETHQWQSSSACQDTTQGKRENAQSGSGQQQKNTEEDDSKANQESSGTPPQESNGHNAADDATTQLDNQQSQQTLLIISNNANLDNKIIQQEPQLATNIKILPLQVDQQVQQMQQQYQSFNNQQKQQAVANSVVLNQAKNNHSRDSSQGNQRLCQISNQIIMPEDGFYAPQSRLYQSAQITSQQFQSQQHQNTLFGQHKLNNNFNIKKVGSSGGPNYTKGRTPQHKESKQSRRSKHSKESESRSYGKSSSLQRFQQAIPKKEYKDEMDLDSQGGDPHSHQKHHKTKPPQNNLSNIQDNDDSMVHCQQQLQEPKASAVSQQPVTGSNYFMPHPSVQALQQRQVVSNSKLNQSPGQLSMAQLSQQQQSQQFQRQYNDHSMLLFHNSNLSGLQHVLSNLRSLTQPLDQLIKLSQKLFNNHITLQDSEQGGEIMKQILKSAQHDKELIQKYMASLKNSPIVEDRSFHQSRSNQYDKKYPGQMVPVKFEESAVAPPLGNSGQSSFLSYSDRFGNPVGDFRRSDPPISITFKKDQSSMIQKILHPNPVVTNHPCSAYGYSYSLGSSAAIKTSQQPNCSYDTQNRMEVKPRSIVNDSRDDVKMRSFIEDKIESFRSHGQTSEMRAKAFLAQGFQLQDSVKISSQKIWPANQAAADSSEDSDDANQVDNNLIQEECLHSLRNLDGGTQIRRFMNEFGKQQNNKNDQQAIFKEQVIRRNFDIEDQNLAQSIQLVTRMGGASQPEVQYVGGKDMRGAEVQIQGANIQSEAPTTKLDNDHRQRLQKLDQLGQRLFKQQSDMRTNSATVNNESAQRQNDSLNQDGSHQQIAHKSEADGDASKLQKLSQDVPSAVDDDTNQQDKSKDPSQVTQTVSAAQSNTNQPLPVSNQVEQDKTVQIQGQQSQNTEFPKFFEMLLPTELRARLVSQDDPLTQQKLSNGTNDRKSIANVNFNSQEQLMSSLSAFRPQNVNEEQLGPKQYISMTQTQNRSKIDSNADQKKCQADDDGMGLNQNGVIAQELPQGEQRGAELLKQLLMNSKDLNGLAQILQAKGMESQLKNIISDCKDSSVMNQSSGIACVGSVNTANGIHSRGGSGVSPDSGTDSGLKYQEIYVPKDKRENDDKLNGIKDSGGSSGISRHNLNDSAGDKQTSTNNAPNQKQHDETKGSGSRDGSKTNTNNTNGSNTQPNGSTDKETRSNSIGIDKLKEQLGMLLDGNNQEVNGTIGANSIPVNSMMSTLLQGQLQTGSGKLFMPEGQRVTSVKQDVNNDTGLIAQQMLNNGMTSNSQDGLKRLVQQNGQITMGQSAMEQAQSSNQPQSFSQEEHTMLTTQIRNQEKEIQQLKTFILMNMIFGKSNANGGNDESSKFSQQLIQELMIQMLMPSSAKQLTGNADNGDYLQEALLAGLPNLSMNEPSAMAAPAQPQQNQVQNSGQGLNPSNLMTQLLSLQKNQSSQSTTPIGNLLQSKISPQNVSSNQQQMPIQGNLLGKRSAMQRQEPERSNQLQTSISVEPKDDNIISLENDQKTQILKNKLSMIMSGVNGLQQDGGYKLTKQHTQIVAKPIENHLLSADKKKQSAQPNQGPQFIGQKAVSAAKSKEDDKQLLIQSIMRQKTQNSQERQSDLCATLHQGYLESAEHQYEGTSAFLRLKAQIKKNMLAKQFQQMKNEIMCAVNKCQPDTVLIGEKPKRPHHNMGEDTFRGSKFRGVSKNKCKWQMMIMINQKKVYIGAIHTEMEAAKYYDHIAILTQGLHSKTNFAYTAAQLEQIVNDYDFTNDREGYYDYHSQMTSNFDSKHGTKQNMKEDFEDYSLSHNRQQSKRQRIEDVPNIQESSDENQMIGEHLYSEKTVNASIVGNPNINSMVAVSGEPQQNINEQYDNKLQHKIQQLGFESLQHLLTSVQKQKNIQNNGTANNGSSATQPHQPQNNISQNLMTSLIESRSKMAPGAAVQANDMAQQQPRTGAQGANMSQQQSSQVIQQILTQYQIFQQQMPQNANAASGQTESRNPDIQNLQDLRLQLEQSKKSNNISNEMLMHQKASPHMKNLGLALGSQHPQQASMNGQQMVESQQAVNSASISLMNRTVPQSTNPQNPMKPFHPSNSNHQSSQNLANFNLNTNNGNTAANGISFDSWKAIQSHASRHQVQTSMASQQQPPKIGGASTGVTMMGSVQAPQVQQQQAGFQILNAQNQGGNTASGVQNLLHMDDPMQAIDKLQQHLQKEIKIKEQQAQAASIALTGNQTPYDHLSQLTKSMKFKSGAFALSKESQQQFANTSNTRLQQAQVAANSQQSVVAQTHDPYRTPPLKKEDYSTEN